ncbi:MAG: LamG domain-containing protein, partial [Candidatus Bathyarchaeia archaeon]
EAGYTQPPTPTPTPTPEPIPVVSGLCAYYPFDGDFQDYSGNGNDGYAEGAVTFTSGVLGQGASFDGWSWIEVEDSPSLDLSEAFTFSVWLYLEDAGTGGWGVILSKGDNSAIDNSSPYALTHTFDGLYPSLRLVQNNYYTTLSSSERVDFKDWHLLTVTWDGREITFYIDDEIKDTYIWEGVLPNSDSKLLIGCDPPGDTEYFRGIMDELRIYNDALTQSEVRLLFDEGINSVPTPSSTHVPSDAFGQWASDAFASSEYASVEYSAMQATGEPDTTECGDQASAWSPSDDGEDTEWLWLYFDIPVHATKIRVHETYNSGFIIQVDVIDMEGELHTVWTGIDETPCPGWFEITFPRTPYLVQEVFLYTEKSGFEEVDAVELIGDT